MLSVRKPPLVKSSACLMEMLWWREREASKIPPQLSLPAASASSPQSSAHQVFAQVSCTALNAEQLHGTKIK